MLIPSDKNQSPKIIRFWGEKLSASQFHKDEFETVFRKIGFWEKSIQKMLDAYDFAVHILEHETIPLRRNGERCLDHAVGTVLILMLEYWERDIDTLIAGLFHDILEEVRVHERKVIRKHIILKMGQGVCRLVDIVTKPEENDFDTNPIKKKQHFHWIWKEKRAVKIKCGDRCYNIRTHEMMLFPREKITQKHLQNAREQAQETRRYLVPIARSYWVEKILMEDLEALEDTIFYTTSIRMFEEFWKRIRWYIGI